MNRSITTLHLTREYVYANGTLLAVLDRVPETANAPIFNADMDGDGAITVDDFLQWYFNYYLLDDVSREVTGDGVMDANDANTVWACASVQNSCLVASYRASIYYVHNDHLGTPMALTNEAGAKVWSAMYDPFGKATVNEDVDENGELVTLNIRFPGQYCDQETGLHYNYFRYYDPNTGRYLTSDPIGLDGGLNTFGYALSNPLIYFDPLGLVCRQTARRGLRCSPGPGRGGGRVGVFGCLIGCVSFTQGDSEAQASLQPTIGGGLSICSPPKEPEPSCEDEKEEEKDCGIYDPNCDDELNFGISPPGRCSRGPRFWR